MEKIKILKLEAQKRKQLSKQSLKKNKSKRSTPIGPIKTAKRTTEPVGFQFKTDDRFKPKLEGESVGNQGSSTFPMNLRSYHKTDFLPNDPSEVEILCVCLCVPLTKIDASYWYFILI